MADSNTFNLDGWADPVVVKHSKEITKEQIIKHSDFEKWVNTMKSSLKQQKFRDHPFHAAPYKLKEIEVQSQYMIETKSGSRPLFINIVAKVENEKGESLPGVAFLRGGAVAVLIILRPSDSLDERYVVMTDQPRIPAGSLSFMEIPAGMIDPEDGSFGGAAARELKEEVGLELKAEDLIDMTELVLKGHKTEETLQDASTRVQVDVMSSSAYFFGRRKWIECKLTVCVGDLLGRDQRGKRSQSDY